MLQLKKLYKSWIKVLKYNTERCSTEEGTNMFAEYSIELIYMPFKCAEQVKLHQRKQKIGYYIFVIFRMPSQP